MQSLFAKSETVQSPFRTKNDVAYQALEKSRLDDLPFMEAQEELELLFDKNQLNKRIREEFDVPEFDKLYKNSGIDPKISKDFCINLCVQMCIHKRTTASTLIGILYHHFDIGAGRTQAMQECADALEQAIIHDFVDYQGKRRTQENGEDGEFVVRLQLTETVQRNLDRFQYPLPMMVQPKKLKTNRCNGYVGKSTSRSLVVLKTLESMSFYEEADICLDHLERMNRIPLTLNLQVVALIDNQWKDLDRKRPEESFEDYQQRVKAFERYDECSKDVIQALSQLRDTFWLTHKYDRRGRTYCQGYHINYQGNPWNKAVVEFANKEIVHNDVC